MDKKLTQEELNGLSPRARKAYEDSNTVLSEITTDERVFSILSFVIFSLTN